jgi:hypothetical protein
MAVTYRDSNGKVTEVAYEGAVLGLREQNMYHDSYFHAVVWDDAEGKVRSIEYGATAYYSTTGAQVDASREVIAKAVAHRAAAYLADWEATHGETVRQGYTARVTVDGETLQGTIGWVGEARPTSNWEARYGTPTPRYGVRVEGRRGLIFRNQGAKGLEVDVPAWTEEDRAAMAERAEGRALHDFREALRLADEREPLPAAPAPGTIVDSQEADAEGFRLYAVGETLSEESVTRKIAAAVLDGDAHGYRLEGVRKDGGALEAREVTLYQALHRVALYADMDGARIEHDGRGTVRLVREDGGRLLLTPVRPVEAPQGPQEDGEHPGAAVETQEAPKGAEAAVEGVKGTEGDPAWVARRDGALEALRGLMDGGAGRYRRTVLIEGTDARGMSDTMPTAVARAYLAEEVADGGELSKPGMGLRLLLVRANGARLELVPARGVVPLGG